MNLVAWGVWGPTRTLHDPSFGLCKSNLQVQSKSHEVFSADQVQLLQQKLKTMQQAQDATSREKESEKLGVALERLSKLLDKAPGVEESLSEFSKWMQKNTQTLLKVQQEVSLVLQHLEPIRRKCTRPARHGAQFGFIQDASQNQIGSRVQLQSRLLVHAFCDHSQVSALRGADQDKEKEAQVTSTLQKAHAFAAIFAIHAVAENLPVSSCIALLIQPY